MQIIDRPPYHLFEMRGRCFVYDIAQRVALQIDRCAYAALQMRLDGAAPSAIRQRLTDEFGSEHAGQVLGELAQLQRRRLLTGPVRVRDATDDEQQVQALLRQSSDHITLTVAELCNLRCRYCYIGTNQALDNGVMSEATARDAVDFTLRRAGRANPTITFFGGEPLTNRAVVRFVLEYATAAAAAEGRRVRFSMTTNGTLVDEEVLGWVTRYGLGIMVSVDGPPDVHDAMRPYAGGRGSHARATQTVRALVAAGRRMTVRCTVTNQCTDLPRIVADLEALGVDHIAVTPAWGKSYFRWPYDVGPQDVDALNAHDDALLQRLFARLDAGEHVQFDPWYKAVQAVQRGSVPRTPCGVGRGTLTVGINGNLYPCHRYVGMHNYIVGDIWHGVDQARLADYYRTFYATRRACRQCWAVNLCKQVCPWYVSHEDGHGVPPPEWFCNNLRRWYETGIWLSDILQTDYPDYFAQIERSVQPRSQQRRAAANGCADLPPDATRHSAGSRDARSEGRHGQGRRQRDRQDQPT